MRDVIEKELAFSVDVIRDGHEVVPRFHIDTPDGAFVVLCPLPDDINVRFARMELVSKFMASKLATRFVMSSELMEPDAVSAIGVTRTDTLAGVRLITRKPLAFGDVQWLGSDQVGVSSGYV